MIGKTNWNVAFTFCGKAIKHPNRLQISLLLNRFIANNDEETLRMDDFVQYYYYYYYNFAKQCKELYCNLVIQRKQFIHSLEIGVFYLNPFRYIWKNAS